MIRRRLMILMLLLIGAPAFAQLRWREGEHYQLIPAAAGVQRAGAPADKIEVAEAFSYGCPYCFKARDDMAKLAASLPPDAAMAYLHASFVPAEGWPVFQRGFYTARKLGIAAATHDAMFRAIWETGEVPLVDVKTGRLRPPLPTMEDLAKFYARAGGVKAADFLKVARSPEIDAEMQRADALVKAWRVPGTPALIVNGRYMVNNDMPYSDQAQVVIFLIALERARIKK